MADFSQDIQNFQRDGTYTYKFDSSGNFIFDSSSLDFSNVYLSLPLSNIKYDYSKLNSFVDPSFVEFVPVISTEPSSVNNDELQQQLTKTQEENALLQDQLNSLINQDENNSQLPTQIATKQVILELRKALGQGRVDSDFSADFPYTPIRKDNNS